MSTEKTDVLVIGTGFGGAIPAFHLAAGGAKVLMLERGPWLDTSDLSQDYQLGTYTRILDLVMGTGVEVIAGNCVGGSSVVYLAASMRAPTFVFERKANGVSQWPASVTRGSLDPWYDIVEENLPVAQQPWNEVSYSGGLWAGACARAGGTCNPVPVAVNLSQCGRCGWMATGCVYGAKRSMLTNYLPAAVSAGAEIRPLHEVQFIGPAASPGYRYAVNYLTINPDDYRAQTGGGVIEAKVVVCAAGALGTPVILKRSAQALGSIPNAVGRYFSPNGDHVSLALFNEDKVKELLGLERAPGVPYAAHSIGRSIGTTSFDQLDPSLPEGLRYALQQIYYPPIVNLMPEDGVEGDPVWFGADKKELSKKWPSWMSVLAMVEDENEGVFGTPPPTGNFTRLASAASLAQLTYKPSERTLAARADADVKVRSIVEQDGLGSFLEWKQTENSLSAHPLASCRMGDDPAISALDDHNELRGHPGLFVTDGSAVPTSLCVNPSITIAALAERAAPFIAQSAQAAGISVDYSEDRRPGSGQLHRPR
ncbi:MAG: GMC family oxidoreductase [Actinomycetota bacterium]